MSQPVDTFTTQAQIDSYLNTLSKKYLANNAYIVSGTNTGYISAGVLALAPYANLTNRYFPTVATLPDNSNNLKTKAELGGYFLPKNIGSSVYLTKNITYKINSDAILPGVVYEFIQPNVYNKGRGLTETDQSNVVQHIVDNTWMKSVRASSVFDGTIINTNVYQKFIPYQSKYETLQYSTNGVVTTQNDFEFWTSPQKSVWNVTNKNFALTPEKYFDLQGRIDSLVVLPNKELYSWNTDIFGNQYGVYQEIALSNSLYASTTAIGNLWVKIVDGTVSQAPSALKLIYNNYKNYNFYPQLTSNQIVNLEVFFDTLVIQLSSTVLYEKINFNYENFQIESGLQSYSPLYYTPMDEFQTKLTLSTALSTRDFYNTYYAKAGVSAVTLYGGNWYDSKTKKITICTLLSSTVSANSLSLLGAGVSSLIVPVLYELDLNSTNNKVRVFPTETTDFVEYIYPLNNGRNVTYMEPPVFTYNEDTKAYLTTFITFSGNDNNGLYGAADQKMFLTKYKIKL